MRMLQKILVCTTFFVATSGHAQSFSKTETITYSNNTAIWVLGQVTKVTCTQSVPATAACDGGTNSVESETTFDSNAMPQTTKIFGKVKQTRGYDTVSAVNTGQRGTLKTITDGNGHATTLTSWYRGVPRIMTSADSSNVSASVTNIGSITSVVDENGYATGYGYDAMGRLASIHYPESDSTNWNDTTIVYQQTDLSTGTEYGIPGGHWKRIESTGNGRKVTYYDGMWRPLVEEQYDNANATATRSAVVKRYDISGRLTFQSYPVANLPNGYADAALKGINTFYDALNRVTEVDQDAETTTPLKTLTAYLTGFKIQVTNPRGYNTTTSYMAFDTPSTDWPVNIQAADGTSVESVTDIARDVFGKTMAIARHNVANTVSETRSYVYDDGQRLCKTIEPETGSTVVDYDGANNMIWSASGQALPSTTTCDRTLVAVADQSTRAYDVRNRLQTLRFPDGRGDQDWTYYPDGQPNQITTYNAANQGTPVIDSYHYNKRRMLDGTGESLQQPGWYTWSAGHGYDGNGHLSVLIYPSGLNIAFAPNAIGQPTQAGSYATGVTYYPNGAIKHFVYGNGIVHDMTPNTRQLPDTSTDAYGTTKFISDGYDYDANGNVWAITDGATGRNLRGNRTMQYDPLDRLNSTTSLMFGNGSSGTASYSYDALDNLTHLVMPATGPSNPMPARNWYYCYDQNWRLTNLKTGSCSGASVVGLGYDTQGNLNNKNGQTYTFGDNNRLYVVTNKESYRYDANGRRVLSWSAQGLGNILSQYTQDGQLINVSNARTAIHSEYIYLGGSLVAIKETPTTGGASTLKYQHTDALGTPVAVTDANRNVIERNEYEPYGQLLNRPITDGPGFAGHVQDAQTGLTYMQQRYYDPTIGRFLSVDPVTALNNPIGMFNRYDYAYNSPYNFTDADGRAACPKDSSGSCIDAPKSESGKTEQPGPNERQQAKDNQVRQAFNRGRMSDGTPLNTNEQTDVEQGIRVTTNGTYSNPFEHICWACSDGDSGTGGQYNISALQEDDSAGHTHPGLNQPLPGRGDAGLTSVTKQGVYMLSRQGAFVIEKTAVGYRIRQLSGDRLNTTDRERMRRQVDEWNRSGGASNSGGVSCSSKRC